VYLSLILLDLNLPGKDGHSVLKYIKRDVALCDIPDVILSTSNNPRMVSATMAATPQAT
jgi:CheY-like chemotaxis protein